MNAHVQELIHVEGCDRVDTVLCCWPRKYHKQLERFYNDGEWQRVKMSVVDSDSQVIMSYSNNDGE